MRLLLVRHGQTPANVMGQLDTAHPGPRLTELGALQAARIPDALRHEDIDAIFASTLVRTQLTAAPLAADRTLRVTVLGGIHEIDAGSLEKRSDRDSVRTYIETIVSWGSGDRDRAMPDDEGRGETGHDFFGRFDADVREVLDSGAGTAVIVSHGAAIRTWVAGTVHNVAPSFAADHDLSNTGVVVIDGSFDDGFTLVEWAGLPIGGAELEDATAPDPTGVSLDEVGE